MKAYIVASVMLFVGICALSDYLRWKRYRQKKNTRALIISIVAFALAGWWIYVIIESLIK